MLAPSLFASPSKTAAADGADYCAAAQAFVPAAKAMAVIADIATKALPERFIKIIPRAGLLSVSCFTLNTPILLGTLAHVNVVKPVGDYRVGAQILRMDYCHYISMVFDMTNVKRHRCNSRTPAG